MSQNGDNLYSTLRVPPPIVTYSHLDSSIIQINASGALVNHGDIILEGKLKNNTYTNTPMLSFNTSSTNVSGALFCTSNLYLQGSLTCSSTSNTPMIKLSGSLINASGTLVCNRDVSLLGNLTNYTSTSNTPMIGFNGSSINVSSTLINTNSGVLFSNVGNVSGVPFSSVLPTDSWAHSGRLYYTNMTDSNDNTIKVLCIV